MVFTNPDANNEIITFNKIVNVICGFHIFEIENSTNRETETDTHASRARARERERNEDEEKNVLLNLIFRRNFWAV